MSSLSTCVCFVSIAGQLIRRRRSRGSAASFSQRAAFSGIRGRQREPRRTGAFHDVDGAEVRHPWHEDRRDPFEGLLVVQRRGQHGAGLHQNLSFHLDPFALRDVGHVYEESLHDATDLIRDVVDQAVAGRAAGRIRDRTFELLRHTAQHPLEVRPVELVERPSSWLTCLPTSDSGDTPNQRS